MKRLNLLTIAAIVQLFFFVGTSYAEVMSNAISENMQLDDSINYVNIKNKLLSADSSRTCSQPSYELITQDDVDAFSESCTIILGNLTIGVVLTLLHKSEPD